LATKKQTSTKPAPKESASVDAAKVIETAGKTASLTGATPEARRSEKAVKKGKLAPKHKARLPRREKKALKKAQASR
jgi:hypothetical protein